RGGLLSTTRSARFDGSLDEPELDGHRTSGSQWPRTRLARRLTATTHLRNRAGGPPPPVATSTWIAVRTLQLRGSLPGQADPLGEPAHIPLAARLVVGTPGAPWIQPRHVLRVKRAFATIN